MYQCPELIVCCQDSVWHEEALNPGWSRGCGGLGGLTNGLAGMARRWVCRSAYLSPAFCLHLSHRVPKVGMSVGGWAILQKTCDLALKNAQQIYAMCTFCYIMLHKKMLQSKNFIKERCQDMCPVERIS